MAFKTLLLVSAFALLALTAREARAQTAPLQGAWLEEGEICTDVFIDNGKALVFRRPASAFSAAFVIQGRQLATPLAHCRIGRIAQQGERQVMQLSCTTSISINAARAVFALRPDGGLDRYSAADGGMATRYRRCTPEALKTP